MLLMKACNRCKGDLFVEQEGRFHDLVCLQCGNRPKDGAERAARLMRARMNSRAGVGGRWPFGSAA